MVSSLPTRSEPRSVSLVLLLRLLRPLPAIGPTRARERKPHPDTRSEGFVASALRGRIEAPRFAASRHCLDDSFFFSFLGCYEGRTVLPLLARRRLLLPRALEELVPESSTVRMSFRTHLRALPPMFSRSDWRSKTQTREA
ncbi:hypothetical protein Cob_v006025 [Colletotrichum orbiculare MAFF 240422]|uniref:Uncharacterized protein n=1 Tax=Colletotrichum orbiculare (strain 104-T / ATCC 96160 / CBS 514.97 / LARS 414 / MAFF 240422) TaxID=1213857 RepID=A0A484FT09_COLOR|nr:hypothetical protein Cob_v006025 [Colletotrichum orbiculare MAFF 240422]